VLVAANAARRGFLREASLLAGLLLSIWLAGRLYRPIGALLLPSSFAGSWSTELYTGLTLLLLLVAAGLTARLVPQLRRGPLVLLDCAAGLGIGLCEAALVAGLILIGARQIGLPAPLSGPPAATAAQAATTALAWLISSVPAEAWANSSRR
jgi:uncharacterized membrane protein required for colicin V production